MSGLAAVLAGHTDPGIYHWHGAFDVATVGHTVEHAGWLFSHLDGWQQETKEEFLTGIGEVFEFGAHYGHNFDALSDCLHDLRAGDSSGHVLLWDGWGPFARADTRAFSVALSVLGGRVNSDRGGPFVVLLRGDGPHLDGVASID